MSLPNITRGETRLAYVDRGQGAPLLCLHGFPLDHSMWDMQTEFLALQQRVIVPDLRGFGESSVCPGTVTMEQMADDCVAILDELQITAPVTVMGLSMGGYVAWPLLRKYSERIGRVILCDTRAVGDTPQGIETRLKMAAHVLEHGTSFVAEAMIPKLFAPDTILNDPAVVELTRQLILRADPQAIAAAQRGLAERPDVTSWLPGFQQPALVVCGEHDAISPPDEMRQIAEALPNARFVLVPRAGHMSPLENPGVFNTAVREFLAG